MLVRVVFFRECSLERCFLENAHFNMVFFSECSLDCNRGGCPAGGGFRPRTIQIQLLALPRGIRAQTDLLRLSAYDKTGKLLRKTRFTIRNVHSEQRRVPFSIRLQNGIGTVFNTRRLQQAGHYRLAVRATSFADFSHALKYQTDFLIFISISPHPF